MAGLYCGNDCSGKPVPCASHGRTCNGKRVCRPKYFHYIFCLAPFYKFIFSIHFSVFIDELMLKKNIVTIFFFDMITSLSSTFTKINVRL